MCIVVAKYFPGIGWAAAKNRDQDYVPHLSFPDEKGKRDDEIMLMFDKDTGYKEGLNTRGLTIITTSSTESIQAETDDKDGENIQKALMYDTPAEAADHLIRKKLDGYILVFNKEEMILIESDKNQKKGGKYEYVMKTIPHTQTIARTNHGIFLPNSGYQRGIDAVQERNRDSSESRLAIAEKVVKSAQTPMDLINGIAKKWNNDMQLNGLRVSTKPRDMRTCSQILVVPSQKTMYFRPIECIMKIVPEKVGLNLEILSNAYLTKIYPKLTSKISRMTKKPDGTVIITSEEVRFVSFNMFNDYK